MSIRSMQGGIGAVIFDVDGLMLDSEPRCKAAWQAAAAGSFGDLGSVGSCIGLTRPRNDTPMKLTVPCGARNSLALR